MEEKLLTEPVVLPYTKQLAPRECVQHEGNDFDDDDQET